MPESETPEPAEASVLNQAPKKKRFSGRVIALASVATAVLLTAAALIGINVRADMQAQQAFEEATKAAQSADRELREAQQLFDKSVEQAAIVHTQGTAVIAATDPAMLSDTELPATLQVALGELADEAELASPEASTGTGDAAASDADSGAGNTGDAAASEAAAAGGDTATEPQAEAQVESPGKTDGAREPSFAVQPDLDAPSTRDEKQAAAANLVTHAITVTQEAERLEARAAKVDTRAEAAIEGQSAILVAAQTKGASLEVPELASQESKDAFLAAVAALGDTSAGIDVAALIVNYQNAWAAVVASNAEAQRNQDPASIEPTYIQGILVVNKTYALPSWYGDGLTAETVAAFDQMQAEAAAQGLHLYISSGFRSYWAQESIYNRYVAADGRAEADRYSARPGHSEHQSGLTFDLNTIDEAFAYTPEGEWVRDNAHRFGFVIRYPQGKEHITGYIWEPWHLRYLGTGVATELYLSGLSLEEYLGITSQYAD